MIFNMNPFVIFILFTYLIEFNVSLALPKQCQIRSKKFPYEYLMNTNQSLTDLKQNLFIFPLARINNMNRMFWTIIPVPKITNVTLNREVDDFYYIRNHENGEYICGMDEIQTIRLPDRLKQKFQSSKRLVQTINKINLSKEEIEKCQWKFKKADPVRKYKIIDGRDNKIKDIIIDLHEYLIINVAFDQKLYVGNEPFGDESSKLNDSFKRKVYLVTSTNKSTIVSNQFKWMFECVSKI